MKAHDDVYILHFDAAKVYTRIMIDPNGLIQGLSFFRIIPAGSIRDQLASMKNLPGKVSYLIWTNGKTIASKAASTPMAVGSTFKLAALLAVGEAVDRGSLAWDEVVALDPAWRSVPSGQLQDWPEGTAVTIATLTHLMISLSDNTAADALIHLVGGETIEQISPQNRPFLTRREAFVLKSEKNDKLRQSWNTATEEGRRRILEKIAAFPLTDAKELKKLPDQNTQNVEWFMTAEEICDLLEASHDMPSLSINQGPIDRAQWRQYAYKGGSEFGVLNLSSRVVGTDGTSHCIVATWNDDIPLDNTQFLAPYQGIVDLLHSETAD
ncbi:MAG: serine hydrolase [Hyphomicrobiales bacterium]